jgi:3-deoxy-manno-octulosonate cytidylyltransferase (CMP-KDO synthetase)
MKIVGIIPSRYSSSRFPGKPLVEIAGKTMVQRVYEQALKANLHDVIVATDDARIEQVVRQFGGKVVMTSVEHNNGTERIAEVAANLDADVVINIQGDEPFIQPEQIHLLADCFIDDKVQIATLAKQQNDAVDFVKSSIVKVVFDNNFDALYFSRSAIPFYRTALESTFYKHIGIYAFRKKVLLEVVQLNETKLEAAEMLEQLRWLQHGYKIKVALTELESVSIDVPEDLERLKGIE